MTKRNQGVISMKNRWIIVIAMILALICVSGLAEVEVPIKIQLEGKTYEMPCELSHFLKNGWELYDYENYEIGDAVDLEQIVPTGDVGETLKTYMLVRKGKVAEIKLKNEHMAEWRLKGCVVSEIRVVESKNPPKLVCEGIEFGVTTKDKLSGWAKESFAEDGFANYHLWDYSGNYSCSIAAFIDEGKAVGHMSVSAEHMTPTKEALNELEGYTEYIPGEFDSYKAPKEFDKDWSTGIIILDGKLYQMPVPIREFITDGWKIIEDTWVMPGDITYCTIVKGDLEVQVAAHNIMAGRENTEQPAKLYNCEADMLFTMPADRSFFRAGYYENGMSELEMKLTSIMKPKQKVQLNERESDEERKFFESSVILSADKPYDTKDATYHHAVYSMTLVVNNGEITQMGVRYSPYYAE